MINDIKLDDTNMDISFSNNDIEIVTDSKSVAQDLRVSLFKSLFVTLNNESISIDEIKEIIKDTAFKDTRIDFESINISIATIKNSLNFTIYFKVLETEVLEKISINQEDITNG